MGGKTGAQEPRIRIEPERVRTDGTDAGILMEAYGNSLDQWQQLVLDCLATGKTGQAAGQGLYDWSQKDADDFRRRKQSPYFAGVKEWAMPDVK